MRKIIIITGAGSGLGSALARELSSQCERLILADIAFEKVSAVARVIGEIATPICLDVADRAQVETLVETVVRDHGRIDCMVNNAGILAHGELLDFSPEQWDRVLSVNLGGVIWGSLAAYRIMVRQKFGQIVNIASLSALITTPLFGPYTTSKAGIAGFTLGLAAEAEFYDVRVSLVCPGNIQTPILASSPPSRFTPAIPVEDAACRIVHGMARNRKIIIFPFYARVLWYLERFHPGFLSPLRKIILRKARA